ncbi:glycosyltransferase [Dactylosporangium sp. CS-047395]|uniref:glycosyltransferase n=1 Tax=Dactylosporangium sp. CS-047395 TaxID=3239936 RepID=UPI003D8A7246
MRVVHVVNVADTGGAQTLVEALVAHRPAGTYAGVVVLGSPGVLSARLAAVADRVDHLGLDPGTWRLDRLLRRVRVAVAVHRAEVVHAHLLQSDLAVALLPGRVARVSTVHTTGFGAGDRVRSRGLARVMARLSWRFAYSVACSRQARVYMAGAGYPARRTLLIENGVALPPAPVDRDVASPRESVAPTCVTPPDPSARDGALPAASIAEDGAVSSAGCGVRAAEEKAVVCVRPREDAAVRVGPREDAAVVRVRPREDAAAVRVGPREEPVFVSLSRWHPMKDHATLFGAFALLLRRHPRYKLRCCGSGVTPGNRELTGLIARLGLEDRVDLCGPVEKPARVLEGAHALVLSSAYGEALPMAGLEALALGVPVVATDVGDCARLCADPGLLARPRDERSLAAALMRVAEFGPAERAALSAAARGIAASFDIRRTVAAYYELYGKVRP